MHEEEEPVDRPVSRRRLLTRGGVIGAVVGGAVVAGAVAVTPAEAATGDPVLQGNANAAGTGSTGLSANPSAANATLELTNNTLSAPDPTTHLTRGGAALRLVPHGDLLSDTAQPGSVGMTNDGTLWFVPPTLGGPLTRQYLYATNNANFTVPLNPDRVIDTRFAAQRARILNPGAIDGAGRVIGGQTINIDLSDYTFTAFGVFVNLTTVSPAADGFLTAFPTGGTKPQTSNVNYVRTIPVWPNFALVPVGAASTASGVHDAISIFVSQSVQVIVDISAAVVADWGSVNPAHFLGGPAAKPNAAQAALKKTPPRWHTSAR
jgi:hypothetical protein